MRHGFSCLGVGGASFAIRVSLGLGGGRELQLGRVKRRLASLHQSSVLARRERRQSLSDVGLEHFGSGPWSLCSNFVLKLALVLLEAIEELL